MANSYRIFPEFNLFVTTFTGNVSSKEFVDAYVSIYADDECHPSLRELVDLRGVIAFDVSLEAFKAVSEMTEHRQGADHAWTAIVSNRPMNQIAVRLYKCLAEVGGAETVKQFTELAPALEWLEVPDFPVEHLK